MRRPERRTSRRVALAAAWALGVVASGACSGGPRAPAPEEDPTRARAAAVKADERAPDLWARAEAADRHARAAGSHEAAADFFTEARLWRQAAIAEAERIDVATATAALREKAEARAKQLASLQAERADIAAQAERLGAGRLALEEAARVLAVAGTEPRRRPQLNEAELRRGTRALLDRARLVVAAARSLGADEAQLAALSGRLDRAEGLLERQPAEALRAADQTLFDAHAVLGPLRGGRVDDAVRQSLVDALRSAGLSPVRSDRGLTARLTPPSPGGVLARRGLERLCKLREAFPAGGWQLALRDPQLARARSRAPAMRKQLAALGCEVDRIEVTAAASGEQPTLEASFLAY